MGNCDACGICMLLCVFTGIKNYVIMQFNTSVREDNSFLQEVLYDPLSSN